MSAPELLFNFFTDVEATQPAVADPALGERASHGIADVLETAGLRGTFHCIPSDVEASPALYRDLAARGHELGLHLHPKADGYEEFLGIYGADMQRRIISEASERFAQVLGFRPATFCPGYVSTNDYTYGVLVELGFRHGATTLPTRVLPECASVHAGAPLDLHYANQFNRLLPGELDFVVIPPTVDPDSRMWGGKTPLDLRVELVDAKNHWYTIKKAIDRQRAAAAPVFYLRAFTHNTFDYSDRRDFRRQTMEAVIAHVRRVAGEAGLSVRGASAEDIAAAYRAAVPRPAALRLELDRRAYSTERVTS